MATITGTIPKRPQEPDMAPAFLELALAAESRYLDTRKAQNEARRRELAKAWPD